MDLIFSLNFFMRYMGIIPRIFSIMPIAFGAVVKVFQLRQYLSVFSAV